MNIITLAALRQRHALPAPAAPLRAPPHTASDLAFVALSMYARAGRAAISLDNIRYQADINCATALLVV